VISVLSCNVTGFYNMLSIFLINLNQCFLLPRHYSVPNHPTIIGIEHYKGKTIHSHFYRDPKEYKGFKNALVLGFGPSGIDISLELSEVCEKVTISHSRMRTKSILPKNCFEHHGVRHIAKNGDFVTSSNDVISDVDLFVICTGYQYDFPFLDDVVDLKMDKGRRAMHNLYKHIFYMDKPSLSFVGIPWKTAPFPIIHQQCGYVAAVLGGLKSLPSEDEMRADTLQEIEQRLSIPELARHFHMFGDRQFGYADMLASLSGLQKNPTIIENLYKYVAIFRSSNIKLYKNMEFKKINDDEFDAMNDSNVYYCTQ